MNEQGFAPQDSKDDGSIGKISSTESSGGQDRKKDPSTEGAGLTESYNWFKEDKVIKSFVDSCAELVEKGQIEKNDQPVNILGIGSGLGVLELRTNEMLKKKGFDTNLFISDFLLKLIADIKNSGQEGEGMCFNQDNKDMPINDDSIGMVLARSVTHYEPTRELERKVLSEILRVLKPGGYFVDQAPTMATRIEADLMKDIHNLIDKEMNIQTKVETEDMLKEYFELEEAEPDHQPIPLPVNKRIFMKRYNLEDQSKIKSIIEMIVAVPKEERPSVWVDEEKEDFGWNIPYTIYKCRKPEGEEDSV